MDWLIAIAQIVFGSGMLGGILFYGSRSRKEKAAAKGAELTNIDSIIKQKDGYIADLRTEQNELKKEKEDARNEAREARKNEAAERDRVTDLYKELSRKNIDEIKLRETIVKLEYYRCEIPDCKKRTPPRFDMTTENLQ